MNLKKTAKTVPALLAVLLGVGFGGRISALSPIPGGMPFFAAAVDAPLLNTSSDDGAEEEDGVVTPFWQAVIDDIHDARRGERIRVNIGRRSSVPADVLRELRGRRVTLTLRPYNSGNITIYGEDVDKVPSYRASYKLSTLESMFEEKETEEESSSATSSRRVVIKNPETPEYTQDDDGNELQPPETYLNTPPADVAIPSTPVVSAPPVPETQDTDPAAPKPPEPALLPPASSIPEQQEPSSSAMPETPSAASSWPVPPAPDDGEEDIEIIAQEDPEETEENGNGFYLFLAAVALAVAAALALLTIVILKRRKK